MFKSLCEAGHQPLKRVIIFMDFSGQPKWLQYQSLVRCGLPSAGEHNLLGKAAPLGGRQLWGEGDSYLLLAAAGQRVQQPGKGDPREHQQYLPQYLLHWPKLVQLLNSRARKQTLICLSSYLYRGMDSPIYFTIWSFRQLVVDSSSELETEVYRPGIKCVFTFLRH